MLVNDIMSKCSTLSRRTPIREAERIFKSQATKILPIVNNGKLVGVVTREDIARALPSDATTLSKYEIAYWLDEVFVEEFMKESVAITSTMSLMDVVYLAIRNETYNFPVVDGNHFLGMVYEKDIFRALTDRARVPLIRVEVHCLEHKSHILKEETKSFFWKNTFKNLIKRFGKCKSRV